MELIQKRLFAKLDIFIYICSYIFIYICGVFIYIYIYKNIYKFHLNILPIRMIKVLTKDVKYNLKIKIVPRKKNSAQREDHL